MLLEKILQSYPKPFCKNNRNLPLPLKNFNFIYGGKGLGKTNLILHYYQNIPSLKKMYINLKDARLNPNKDFQDIQSFCQKENIDLLIIDNYEPYFTLPKLPNLTLISQIPYAIKNFHYIHIPPLSFQEYQQIHKYHLEDALSHFIKYGNLWEGESYNDYNKAQSLQNINPNPTDFCILKNLILNLGLKVSLHQIYLKIKKDTKLSKDRFYEYCSLLQKSKMLFWVEKFEHKLSAKKLYFYNFTLKNAFSFERNFHSLFENMVFLELFYGLKQEIFFTDKLDFYLPNSSLGILCMPFIQQQTLEQKLHKITKEREYCDTFLILTLNQQGKGENLGTPYTILPFKDFALNVAHYT